MVVMCCRYAEPRPWNCDLQLVHCGMGRLPPSSLLLSANMASAYNGLHSTHRLTLSCCHKVLCCLLQGIGRRFANLVLKKADIDMSKRAGELTDEEVDRIITIMQNPRQYKIPDWFLNRQKDRKDGKYSQVRTLVAMWLATHTKLSAL